MIFVAEIGINHNGSLEIAKRMITIAEAMGCDYVKFQKRTPEHCVPAHLRNGTKETPWGEISYMEYKERLEFEWGEYLAIDKHCEFLGIPWFASVWDIDSLEFMLQWKVPFIKVPSACVTNLELLKAVRKTEVPVIISTGMSLKREVYAAVDILSDSVHYILACTSTYPTPPDEVNLRFIQTLQSDIFSGIDIGFSNHCPGLTAMFGATALGAKMLEFHVTLDRSMWGSDQAASIEFGGVRKLIHHVKELEIQMGTGEWRFFWGEEEAKRNLRL